MFFTDDLCVIDKSLKIGAVKNALKKESFRGFPGVCKRNTHLNNNCKRSLMQYFVSTAAKLRDTTSKFVTIVSRCYA